MPRLALVERLNSQLLERYGANRLPVPAASKTARCNARSAIRAAGQGSAIGCRRGSRRCRPGSLHVYPGRPESRRAQRAGRAARARARLAGQAPCRAARAGRAVDSSAWSANRAGRRCAALTSRAGVAARRGAPGGRAGLPCRAGRAGRWSPRARRSGERDRRDQARERENPPRRPGEPYAARWPSWSSSAPPRYAVGGRDRLREPVPPRRPRHTERLACEIHSLAIGKSRPRSRLRRLRCRSRAWSPYIDRRAAMLTARAEHREAGFK
jgi:hypothetical protein